MNEEHRAHDEQASDLSQLLTALLVTLISVAMLLGSFLLAELDTALRPATPTQVVAQRPTATPFLPTLTHQPSPTVPAPPASATPTPTEHQETARPTEEPSPVTPTVTPPQETTPAATPIRTCTRPPGWVVYTVRKGDTLAELARRSGTTLRKLMYGNCLGTTTLFAGQRLYVPRTIYVTPTPEPYVCGPPLHWVIYFVKPGDTLYSLSRRFHVTVEALRRANCLRSNAIDAGQALYVPPLPSTPTPWPTFTPSPSPTPSLTPSPSSTATAPPTSTSTPTVEPTLTLLPTRTAVPPTPTHMPTSTPSSTPVGASPSPTFTATPLPTSTSMPTAPPTATPTTPAPTQTFTFTPVPTETPTPSPIPTATSASTTTHSCTP